MPKAAVPQSAQTDDDVELPTATMRHSAAVVDLDDDDDDDDDDDRDVNVQQQPPASQPPQPPATPDSLPLCCYPPVYVDDLEDHVGWDTDFEDDRLTSALGAAKID